MDSRVTFKEMLAVCLVITSFTITGIAIMNENYQLALLALCGAALSVLLLFMAFAAGEADKILDMSNPSLRNPAKSHGKKKVRYYDRMQSGSITGEPMQYHHDGDRQGRHHGADIYTLDYGGGDFHESVGNMRVYKRGEKIEFNHDGDDEG